MAELAIPHNRWTNRPEYEAAALRVLRSGHVAQGPEVEAFEEELAARFRPGGAACCVSSGTAALRIALRLLGDPTPSIPTYACAALWHAAHNGVFGPELVDCDPGSFAATTATVVVHTYGIPVEVPDTAIEDFTHAPGATIGGRPAGALGAFSVISFGATKPLGIGGGGAVLGPRDAIARARQMRDVDRWNGVEAFNYEMSDVLAAIGRERLRTLDEENERRDRIALVYEGAIPYGFRGQVLSPDSVPYRFLVRVPDAERLRARLSRSGIGTIVPLRPDELLHRRVGLLPGQYQVAEHLAESTLSLPIWPDMTTQQIDRAAHAVATALETAA